MNQHAYIPADVDLINQELLKEQDLASLRASESRTKLVEKMILAGITNVTVGFSGSSDDGAIQDISITYQGKEPNDSPDEDEDLRKEIEDWSYDYLESTGVDWINNEGGDGEIEFDLTNVPLKFECYIDINVTNQHREFSTTEVA